ncbi:hypothetical protein BVC80_1229g3 [Macleaya cordata]|uniref:RNase H type-1 domain-containing protein n=1 Tax=Macleaya cordata TaxID=56857 RepID=A0A200QY90_MACCD|nr:hypothetical protein BVC80_1229g3 [Macleaya cordata]
MGPTWLYHFSVLRVRNNRLIKPQRVTECTWTPPAMGQIKISCDGASIGNPGRAGIGIVGRDHAEAFWGGIAAGLGVCSNYCAEITAIIVGLE